MQSTGSHGQPHKQNTGHGAITLVLVAARSSSATLPRLLASLARFARIGSVLELLMIVPGRDKSSFGAFLDHGNGTLWKTWMQRKDADAIKRYAAAWREAQAFPVRMLADMDVLRTPYPALDAECPPLERESLGGRGTHYRLQMLLKIGVASHVKTDFYLTLDQDVVAMRPFSYGDFVTTDGRAVIQNERRDGRTEHRSSWWESSAFALNASQCAPGPLDPTIGVTPAVVPTRVSLGLKDLLSTLWRKTFQTDAWDLVLFKLLIPGGRASDWTEYTLIYMASCAMGLQDAIFDTKEPGAGKLYRFFRSDSDVIDDSNGDINGVITHAPSVGSRETSPVFGVVQGIETDAEFTNRCLLSVIFSDASK
mmetsp:Transcript_113382/g.184748  ORF Transcript_113382/g.184748 Transcript_113382/m.184748 type:complete len:366 (+) Transcript_113382:194-1291(+)